MKGVKSRGGRKCTPGAGLQKRHDREVYGLGLRYENLSATSRPLLADRVWNVWFVYLIVASDIHIGISVGGRQARMLRPVHVQHKADQADEVQRLILKLPPRVNLPHRAAHTASVGVSRGMCVYAVKCAGGPILVGRNVEYCLP